MNYENEDGITIETPVPGRYTITGFRAATVYVPDVGHLAPPPNIDLPMSPAIAAALRAVLDDYEPESVKDGDAHREAVYLAESIWRAEFQQTAPDWSALDTTSGVISQIDNMYAGIRQQRDQARWDLNEALEELKSLRTADDSQEPAGLESAFDASAPRRGGRRKSAPVETSTEGGQE